MKKVFMLILVLVTYLSYSQAPQGISHRGTVYNSSGAIVVGTVGIEVSILDISLTGSDVYKETFTITTNSLGQYSLNIGQGTPASPYDTTSFGKIKWGENSKFLKVRIDPAGGTNYTITGTNQLMSVPYALYAQNVNQSTSIRTVNTINDLRAIVGVVGDVIYVKGHTTIGDGGGGNFVWKNDTFFISPSISASVNDSPPQTIPSPYYDDNGGTIIQAKQNDVLNNTGRWVREFDGFINVRFFGAFGKYSVICTSQIQKAIDFAASNARIGDPPISGTTVFFPNGTYIVDKIILQNGITLIGDSFDKTIIKSTVTGETGYNTANIAPYNSNYLFEMESGPVQIAMSNFNIVGRDVDRGCFYFDAKTNGTQGGLWYSTFKNIKITKFKGHGIYLKGGNNTSLQIPNQFLNFENVRVHRTTDNSNALKMTGENGQVTFLNCQFDGTASSNGARNKLSNVHISHDIDATSAVVSFINSTFQDADNGLTVDYGENITIDNCWFESVGVAINIDGTYHVSKGINIVNNRFANAAGFGSINATGNILSGVCVRVINSQANIANNFATVGLSYPAVSDDAFIIATNCESITTSGNTFSVPQIGKSSGILSVVTNVTANSIDCKSNKLVFVNANASQIKNIQSNISAGESIYVRANGTGTITFATSDTIDLANKSTLILNSGDAAVFTKIDIGAAFSRFHLTSIVRSTTP